ncbi:hypothetical protein [Celerinatantimonas yamalensis]|uniref:Uncharacterized protein n=1 Tax=Celerinatantimonas yamalensis TaxID=559956 RepID=A0ABW9G356_9GAMM
MNIGGIGQAPYPVNLPKKSTDKVRKRRDKSKKGKGRLQSVADESLLDSVCYDLPPSHSRGALRAYQEICLMARRGDINLIFGVDIYA